MDEGVKISISNIWTNVHLARHTYINTYNKPENITPRYTYIHIVNQQTLH